MRDADPHSGGAQDTLLADEYITAPELMRMVLILAAGAPVFAALSTMRETRAHLALVEVQGQLLGVVTLHEVLDPLLTTAV
ncbi:CBS domain-containing protein [Amycolatopsis methanolica]|uniref:CBS domain-containing protein n=1 Tax=Amycolatopsis methanolica TaxID=1814 RepID=UPI00341A69B5